eukprot:TRINITY_DN409_c0_g1_i3.p1 TRINITY_DN409_c0_g1~~TRINITY_DN409_c0_g1_i3.p1  ORF type:complete len:255 (-),score=30.85 TRINITY_DN409_c0_g1_i3:47-811(-)
MNTDPTKQNYIVGYAPPQVAVPVTYVQPVQPIYVQPAPQVIYQPTYADEYQKPMTDSLEDYGQEDSPELRKGFMRKLYSIVTFQLFITFLITLAASYIPEVGKFYSQTTVFITGIVGMFVFLILTICAKDRVPLNYITLVGFTVCMSTMIAGITAFMPPQNVFRAILLTLIISVALTVATFAMGERLVVWVLFVLIFGISILYFCLFFFIFTRSRLSYSILICLLGVIYGSYLVIDTYIAVSYTHLTLPTIYSV